MNAKISQVNEKVVFRKSEARNSNNKDSAFLRIGTLFYSLIYSHKLPFGQIVGH